MDKSTQRKNISARFSEAFDREAASKRIFDFAISERAFSEARNVYIFLSTTKEPDTDPVIEFAVEHGKNVFCPKVDGERMNFHPYRPGEFSRGAFGIREPLSDLSAPPPDVVFVPLVAFDERMNRLGHGKGYYDRFLADTDVPKLGLAFSFQMLPKVASDDNDVPLDAVITESAIYRK